MKEGFQVCGVRVQDLGFRGLRPLGFRVLLFRGGASSLRSQVAPFRRPVETQAPLFCRVVSELSQVYLGSETSFASNHESKP